MDESPKELFKVWHLLFNKEYALNSDEAKQRFRNFEAKLAYIKSHNSKNLHYRLGLNQFSDLTKEEFEKMYLTEINVEDPKQNFLSDEDDDDLMKRNLQNNTAINWTSVFPPIRSQEQCGSCWAFAASGAIDGNRGLKFKRLENTSPQQLVDCDTFSNGCNGGSYANSFNYIQTNGLMFENDYSYKAAQEPCKFRSNAKLVKITGTKFCNNNQKVPCSISIVYGLLKQGPLAVSLDASQDFIDYESGVFTAACRATNHAVVLVGYGYDAATKLNYWLVRNSWGPYWGDRGYIKVAVNDSNQSSCFITTRAYLPLVSN